MFRGALSVLPLLLLFGLVSIPEAGAQHSKRNTISIWEVRDEDNVVYLAGSVHLLRESDLPIPAGYYRAYQDSDHIYFELDMAQISQPEMKRRMIELGRLPENQNLSFYLSGKTLRKLHRHVAEKGIPGHMMDRLKPGMVLLTLSALSAGEKGASADNGVEALLYRRCVEDRKATSGLETPEFQLSMFDGFSPDLLEKLIHEAIEESGPDENLVENLIQAWREGDCDAVEKLIFDQSPESAAVHEIVMAKRNRSWLPVIEKSIAGKRNEMFVVGAGHLIGKDGVVDLLRKKGYRVRQLTNESLVNLSAGRLR